MLHSTLPGDDPHGEEAAWLAELVDRFESAWKQGQRPVVDAYLPSNVKRRHIALAALTRVDFQWQLKQDPGLRVEKYLQRFPDLANDACAIAGLLAIENHLRCGREPVIGGPKYADHLPNLVESLQTEDLSRVGGTAPDRPVSQGMASPFERTGATFSPDGKRLASASTDQTAKIWDAACIRRRPLAALSPTTDFVSTHSAWPSTEPESFGPRSRH
jgi:hypothetical protein